VADAFEITVDGLTELEKNLDKLGGEFKEQMIRKALRAGGTIMQAAIMANTPINPVIPGPKSTALPPGALQSDVHLSVSKDKETDSFSAWIYFGKSTVRYARWVEWGHRLVHGGRYKSWGKRGKGKEIGDVVAHPFIRPAFEGNIDLVATAINNSMRADLSTRKLGG
jgi:HK97 gp10 family phage protein